MLDFLLNLGVNIRTKKGTGGVSIESNLLHVAINIGFYSAANRILEHEGHVPFGKRNRLIDEKDQNKKTPWALAIEKDMETYTFRFTALIGQYHPSGYVESYTPYGPKDGYELARATDQPQIIRIARRYLKAPNYGEHKENKRRYGRRTTSPVSATSRY